MTKIFVINCISFVVVLVNVLISAGYSSKALATKVHNNDKIFSKGTSTFPKETLRRIGKVDKGNLIPIKVLALTCKYLKFLSNKNLAGALYSLQNAWHIKDAMVFCDKNKAPTKASAIVLTERILIYLQAVITCKKMVKSFDV